MSELTPPHDAMDPHQHIIQIFTEQLNVDVPDITTDLVETGILDSLTFVELLMGLEQEFSINITIETLDIDHFRSVAKITEYIVDQTMTTQRVA